MTLLKLLINIFVIYAIWQVIRMLFSVKKVQQNFQDQVNDLNQKARQPQEQPGDKKKDKDPKSEGEYIDYEEIK